METTRTCKQVDATALIMITIYSFKKIFMLSPSHHEFHKLVTMSSIGGDNKVKWKSLGKWVDENGSLATMSSIGYNRTSDEGNCVMKQ